jgi:hypothetical protein
MEVWRCQPASIARVRALHLNNSKVPGRGPVRAGGDCAPVLDLPPGPDAATWANVGPLSIDSVPRPKRDGLMGC